MSQKRAEDVFNRTPELIGYTCSYRSSLENFLALFKVQRIDGRDRRC